MEMLPKGDEIYVLWAHTSSKPGDVGEVIAARLSESYAASAVTGMRSRTAET